MNHDNNDNNINGSNSNSNHPKTWTCHKGRYDRYANTTPTNNSAQSPIKPPMDDQAADMMGAFGVSTDFVNSIKQNVWAVTEVDRISPVDSPVEHNNISPIHHQQSGAGLEGAAALWQMDLNNWSPPKVADVPPYPKCIPTLNGSPYDGGPSTSSPSPIGSSRCSPNSNSSPHQVVSGSSSPMMSDYSPPGQNCSRRRSAEEMPRNTAGSRSPDELLLNLHNINRASSSQSPENIYTGGKCAGQNRNRADSRYLDDENYACYFPTHRSAASGAHMNWANAMDRVDSNQGSLLIQEISSSMASTMAVRDLVPYEPTAQNIARSNQLVLSAPNQRVLPAPNQRGLSNRQRNNMPNQLQRPIGYPIPGQLALPAPVADRSLFFVNRRMLSDEPIHYCAYHRITQRYYCQTCTRLFCSVCGCEYHVGHVSISIRDATEFAQKQLQQVIDECRFGMAVIQEDIDKLLVSVEFLDAKAREALQAVRHMTRQLTEALHARESQLVEIIESARRSKQQVLDTRAEGLRSGLARLNQLTQRLIQTDAPMLTSDPFDLNTTNAEASAQLYQIKAMHNDLPPLEDHLFKVELTEANIIEILRTLSKINTGNGHMSDRRIASRRNTLSMTPRMPVPRGRAIPSANFPVSLRPNCVTSNGSPYLDLYNVTLCIGGDSSLEENLCRPWGVACDRNGYIVIADRSNNRIQIFRKNGTFVRRFGCYGDGRCQFNRPAGVAVDARRRIVVADKDNHRVQILTMQGAFILAFGEKGSEPGLFTYPWDVAVNDACQIVVSDTRNHRIQLFSPEGAFLRKFGFEAQPQMWKCFDSPRGVVFNHEGKVLVTDFNNHRILVVDADFLNARWLGCKNMAPVPAPPKIFMRPQGIAVDDNGYIIVSDSRNNRVQILDKNGECRWRFGSPGTGPGQFDRPSGLAITPDGNVCVVDFGNNRMLMF